jgi:hypothetical protein
MYASSSALNIHSEGGVLQLLGKLLSGVSTFRASELEKPVN